MTDLHVRMLRRAARIARERLVTHRATAPMPPSEHGADTDRRLEEAATAADERLSDTMDRRRRPAQNEHSVAELEALASHARERVALYRRRIYLGRGHATQLAELERISAGAQERARRARRGGTATTDSPTNTKDAP